MQRLNVIGPAVRRLRVGRGLTQEALTARCQLAGWNLSRPTIGKIEAGLRQVTDAELWMLARSVGSGEPWRLARQQILF